MTLYFFANADADWSNPDNWFEDENGVTPAGRLPTSADDVLIEQEVETFGGTDATVHNFYAMANVSTLGGNLVVLGSGTMSGYVFDGGYVGDLILQDGGAGLGYNSYLTGDLTLLDDSFCAGDVTGSVSFYDSSSKLSELYSPTSVTFYDFSSNTSGYIDAPTEFYGYSCNYGGIQSGNASFFEHSSNVGDLVVTTASFHDDASNNGWIEGEAVSFADNAQNFGDLSSVAVVDVYYPASRLNFPVGAIFHGYPPTLAKYFTALQDTDWDNINNWQAEDGGPATDLPDADSDVEIQAPVEIVSGDITVRSMAVTGGGLNFSGVIMAESFFSSNCDIGSDVVIEAPCRFEGGTFFGHTNQPAVFLDATNYGEVDADAVFAGAACNEQTVTGNATFRDNSFNDAQVGGAARFYDGSYFTMAAGMGSTLIYSSEVVRMVCDQSGFSFGGSMKVVPLDVLGSGFAI